MNIQATISKSLHLQIIILSFLIFFGKISTGIAQNYGTALGLRLGYSVGITAKMNIDASKAIEGLIHFRPQGLGLTLLWEKHTTAMNIQELQWFYGAGVHAGIWYEDRRQNIPLFSEDAEFLAGVDGIIGIEYTFIDIPFCASLDYKPLLNIIGTGRGPEFAHGGAISIRYLF